MKSIAVYCGSSMGEDPAYAEAAREMAAALAARGMGLVYGGGNVGLMGVIADEMLRLGGEVRGVIPQMLMECEVGHRGLTELFVVSDMHERKAKMAALADGFVALPGGMGTLEELFEMLTWAQLGIHAKPVGVLNIGGFYDSLVAFIRHAEAEGFIRGRHAALMRVETTPAKLLDSLAAAR